MSMKIWQETPARLVVGVGNVVPRDRALASDLTDSRHH
jgi:hypothetical protein